MFDVSINKGVAAAANAFHAKQLLEIIPKGNEISNLPILIKRQSKHTHTHTLSEPSSAAHFNVNTVEHIKIYKSCVYFYYMQALNWSQNLLRSVMAAHMQIAQCTHVLHNNQ